MKTAHALSSGKLTNVAVSATYSQHNSNGSSEGLDGNFCKNAKTPQKIGDLKSACMKNRKGITP